MSNHKVPYQPEEDAAVFEKVVIRHEDPPDTIYPCRVVQ